MFMLFLRETRADRCRERRYADHMEVDILQNAPFRSQIFKIFFASGGKGALTPLTEILRTLLDVAGLLASGTCVRSAVVSTRRRAIFLVTSRPTAVWPTVGTPGRVRTVTRPTSACRRSPCTFSHTTSSQLPTTFVTVS